MNFATTSSVFAVLGLLSEPAVSAVTYFTASRILSSGQTQITLDLDGDSFDDLQIDVSAVFDLDSDPFYLATTFGSASIAASGAATRSFSVGELVQLSSLAFVGPPGGLMTGGVYNDVLGNVVAEGWGGASSDDLGNLVFPPGGPTNQIDLFLVKLGEDVAWVDIDSGSFSAIAGRIDFSWGLLKNPGNSFQIAGIPEPGISTLLIAAFGLGAIIRQRKPNKNR
jgi:hypothetical protein